jgi:poly-gamma-glutamate synthesis protein (capsule biosynthesis protein)
MGVVADAAPTPNVQELTKATAYCLANVCCSGAADDSIGRLKQILRLIDTANLSTTTSLSVGIKSVLSFLNTNGTASSVLPSVSGIQRALLERAAAACDLRAHHRSDELVLSFAGDCTFGAVNSDYGDNRFPALYARSGQRNYPFALVEPWFVNDDLSTVNFECTLTNSVPTANKRWKFKGDGAYASIFPLGSVDLVGLANNHSFDYLQAGFNDTVENFKKAGVPSFYQNTPFISTIKGVQVVIIGDCTVVGENTTDIDGTPSRVLRQIKEYKRPDNLVIVVMHWGSELDTAPRAWQQTMGRSFIDAGADAVVGAHPHVLQGIELYKGRYIAYSLGNFAFGGNSLARHPETIILRLGFRLNGNYTFSNDLTVVPCLTTSGIKRNSKAILFNNYQPTPVFGIGADKIISILLQRSKVLKQGIHKINYLRLN